MRKPSQMPKQENAPPRGMSPLLGWSLLMVCFAGCAAIAIWQALAGEWVASSIFWFLAGNANAFATAAVTGWGR